MAELSGAEILSRGQTNSPIYNSGFRVVGGNPQPCNRFLQVAAAISSVGGFVGSTCSHAFCCRAGARFATAPAGRNTSRTDQINLAGAAADSQPAGAARAVCRPQPELHESCAVNRYRFHDIRHAQTLPRAAATLVTPVPLLMSSLQLWQC